MRIQRIGIQSVLHYDDFDLSLGEGPSRLHILHGPNEAGKSTLLRILLDLFYGESSRDFLRNAYTPSSRIDATLTLDSPSSVQKRVERKKFRNRLVLSDQSDLSEEVLGRDYLAGYDRQRFALLFGFDHQTLRDGGENLMRSGGHAGISLFEAGSGIQHLQNLLADLSKRSTDLVDPTFRSNSNRELSQALRAYQQAEASKRSASLRAEDWQGMREGIHRLEQRASGLTLALQQQRAQQRKLERALRVLSPLATLHGLRQELEHMDTNVLVPDSVVDRVPTVIDGIDSLRKQLTVETQERDRFRQQLEAISRDPLAIEHAEAILLLHEGVLQFETYREQELPEVQETMSRLRSAIEFQLADLAPAATLETLETLRIPLADRKPLLEILQALPQAEASWQESEQRFQEMISEQQTVLHTLQQLSPLPDPAALDAAIAEIRAHGDTQQQLADLSKNYQKKQAQLQKILKRQTVYTGTVHDLIGMTVPLRSTVARYQEEFSTLRTKIQQTQTEWQNASAKLRANQSELDTLNRQGAVPVAAELQAQRRHRDYGWSLIKQVWLDQVKDDPNLQEFTRGQSLDRAFEDAMAKSDEMADRMWQEGTAVARRQTLLDETSAGETQILSLTQHLERDTNEFSQLHAAWQAEWRQTSITAKDPEEMKEFLDTVYTPLVEGCEELDHLADQKDRLLAIRAQDTARLETLLVEVGSFSEGPRASSDLTARLLQAEEYLQNARLTLTRHQTSVAQQELLERRLVQEEKTRTKARNHYDELVEAWRTFRERYPALPEGIDAEVSYLQALKTLFEKAQELNGLAARRDRIEAALAQFHASVQVTAAALNEDARDLQSISLLVRKLRGRLEAARSSQETFAHIESEARTHEEHIETIQANLDQYDAELDAYVREYGALDVDDLNQRVRMSLSYQQALQAYANQEGIVLQAAGNGYSLPELEAELATFSDSLEQNALEDLLSQSTQEMEGLEEELAEVNRQLIEQRVAFGALDGQDTLATDHAQEAQARLIEIDRIWNEYLRVELARRLLEQAIDQFRGDHESAIIERAGQFFSELTVHRYQGVVVEYDDTAPRLKAIDQMNRSLNIGDLSDGTRDQLFLALRLAFLEQHATHSEPLPLIMDDILVHFDDERTEATLRILAELGQKMQVLYFTHHQAVVDAASALSPALPLSLHSLPPRSVRLH